MELGTSADAPDLPVHLLGHGLNRLPRPLIDRLLARLTRALGTRHPALTNRLAGLDPFVVAVYATDLDFDLEMCWDGTSLTLARSTHAAGARVSGPAALLLELVAGRVDGDALFFSGQLTVEGRTDLVVGLRNALDGEDIDPEGLIVDATGLPPRLGRTALRAGNTLLQRARHDWSRLAAGLFAPTSDRVAALEERVASLQKTVRQLDRDLARKTRRAPRPSA